MDSALSATGSILRIVFRILIRMWFLLATRGHRVLAPAPTLPPPLTAL